MKSLFIAPTLLLAASGWTPSAVAAPALLGGASAEALLPVDEAFRFEGAQRVGDAIELRWTIAPGYYLYRHQLKLSAATPAGLKLADLQLPKGEAKHDEEAGEVQIYRALLTARLPIAAGATVPSVLKLRYQGCADIGVCYPPQTKLVKVGGHS